MNARSSWGKPAIGSWRSRSAQRTPLEPSPVCRWAVISIALGAVLAGIGAAPLISEVFDKDSDGFSTVAFTIFAATGIFGVFVSLLLYRCAAKRACFDGNEIVKLKSRVAQYERVVDAAPLMFWATDRNGEIRYVNRRWTEFIDHDVSQPLAEDWNAAISADDFGKWQRCHDVAMRRTRTTEVELRMRGKDGGMCWIAVRLAPFEAESGESDGYVGSAIDISERKRAEQTLAASEARVRAIVDTAVDPTVTIDAEGIVESFNAAAVRAFGYAADEVVGRNVNALMPEPYASEHDHYIRRYLATGERRIIGVGREVTGRRKDGSEFPIELTVSQWTADGKRRFTGVVRDITERKEAERRAAEASQTAVDAQAQLEQYAITVELANVEAQLARDQAEAANRTKSDFLANMSHEIRTPMTAILGYADLLVEEFGESGSAGEWLKTIKSNGEHLLALINDILDLSKIEAGRMSIETVEFRPRELVRDVESLLRGRAVDKGLSLQFHVSDDMPSIVRTDPTRLKQVLINLIGNAIKFTASGSVRVDIARRRGNTGDKAVLDLVVRDTGIGMSEDQLRRLFQPFMQADSSTTRRFGGTGLGLTISRRLANMLGGDITVESELGAGSTFRVAVEAVEVAEAAATSSPSGAGAAAENGVHRAATGDTASADAKPARPTLDCRILLAEDGIDNQRLISLVLRKAGAEVTIVENGQAAVEHALGRGEGQARASEPDQWPFDVVLMDMQMPICDGYEATRRLRAEGYDGPIIALTANAMSDDRQKCLDAGCSDYAAKPIHRETLLATIAHHAACGNVGASTGKA